MESIRNKENKEKKPRSDSASNTIVVLFHPVGLSRRGWVHFVEAR
jgi:hypothetical protein